MTFDSSSLVHWEIRFPDNYGCYQSASSVSVKFCFIQLRCTSLDDDQCESDFIFFSPS